MSKLRFGVIGSGRIADFTARAISRADSACLSSVASKHYAHAQDFAREHHVTAYKDWHSLLEAEDLDVIYVATPTAQREAICLAALANRKHLISEKPFLNTASLNRITARAQAEGLAFMDATHFTHHPRTAETIRQQTQFLGPVNRIHSAFFTPMMDRDNIRFDPHQEPTGAIGDICWYTMRAIIEFMRPTGEVKTIAGAIKRDTQTGTIVSGAGLIEFTSGQTSTFGFGYDAGVWQTDLDIHGERGLIQFDDFVLDWRNDITFSNPEYTPEFIIGHEQALPGEFKHQQVPIRKSQEVQMIENFCRLTRPNADIERSQSIERTQKTQLLIDQYCQAVGIAV
ncbi:Gfo/Idh/MocA family oxidoreductase [Microbulbifer sp. OS29]|uniref:Gfo/Idh/MocA family oxidoreductase n=1 Tax=Microbulbifer okhotskensis TaxID=2926617 RepID=A0A9X2EP74_9GAMM|nr:Gfo/Idh/MocA family oxidoreductase [Microbulbifer okhotskensis]MCO1335884.1 Gfo/Idh/MocA family oxidoreductase [Microbulbifer okhotskensis]